MLGCSVLAVSSPGRTRARLKVSGTVQGVGFRPFLHNLASRHALAGFVRNDADGVTAEVEGAGGDVDAFICALDARPPVLARVERIEVAWVELRHERAFRIVESDSTGRPNAQVAADSATCEECLSELWDPSDRRFRYPFVNCTNCGPRFSIVRDVPYDRRYTTMAGFEMCEECVREYGDPADRRYHAQPLCCPACGPTLRLVRAPRVQAEPIRAATLLLRQGAVLAVKGLGGYHLAALASDRDAVERLRSRKHREDKPFAVMVADLTAARRLCSTTEPEEAMLSGRQRPIVLCARRVDAPVAPAVAPCSDRLGLMLPYSGLHHLLCDGVDGPMVLTSGNVSDEPIAYRDEEAIARLAGIADAFLSHDRAIQVRTDDSVLRSFRGRPLPLRRSRGFVPEGLPLPVPAARPLLACGAELKHTFCLAKARTAYVSQHIGDLENAETFGAFLEGVGHFRRLFDVEPALVAYDLHPDYLSSKHALGLEGVDLVGVAHHHAHVASCLADNAVSGPAVGVAFDGLGLGMDGTLWGGEFLVADLTGFRRAAHLEAVPMPGGAKAIKEPWRMAAAFLARLAETAPERGGSTAVAERHPRRWEAVTTVALRGPNAPLTSSAGRLFDAVAAITGVRDSINYEGQAAIELEHAADPSELGTYDIDYEAWTYDTEGSPLVVRTLPLVAAILDDMSTGTGVRALSARFHNTLAELVASVAALVAAGEGLDTVALSGGVFQNALLLERTVTGLERRGLRVLVHREVPPNDGGISYGQAVIAAAVDTASRGR